MESLIVPNEVFFSHILEEIDARRAVRIPVKGNSMLPFIRPLTDQVELSELTGQSVTKGNIVLARTNGSNYVVHRIEKVEGEVVTLRGDGNLSVRERCDKGNVVAEVTAVYKKGRKISKGSLEWNLARDCWFTSPLLRRFYLGISRNMKKIFFLFTVLAFLAA